MEFGTDQCTGLYMVKISVMKELITLNNKFYRIRRKERKQFLRHFNIYECLNKWLEKPPWLVNIKFFVVIVTDMSHKCKIRSLLKVFL